MRKISLLIIVITALISFKVSYVQAKNLKEALVEYKGSDKVKHECFNQDENEHSISMRGFNATEENKKSHKNNLSKSEEINERKDTKKDEDINNDLKLQKSKAQIQLLKQVIEEFRAQTPEEAAEIWAKGEKTRNGVFQYMIACEELKNKIQQELGSMEDNLWVIGTSSPWVKSYKIMPKKEIDKNTYEIKIKYYWTSSTGEIIPSEVTLTVIKQKDSWCVNNVKA